MIYNSNINPELVEVKECVFNELSLIKPSGGQHAYIFIDSIASSVARVEEEGSVLLNDGGGDIVEEQGDIIVLVETTDMGDIIRGRTIEGKKVELFISIFSRADDYTVGSDYARQVQEVLFPYGFYKTELGQRDQVDKNLTTLGVQQTILTMATDLYTGYRYKHKELQY